MLSTKLNSYSLHMQGLERNTKSALLANRVTRSFWPANLSSDEHNVVSCREPQLRVSECMKVRTLRE